MHKNVLTYFKISTAITLVFSFGLFIVLSITLPISLAFTVTAQQSALCLAAFAPLSLFAPRAN